MWHFLGPCIHSGTFEKFQVSIVKISSSKHVGKGCSVNTRNAVFTSHPCSPNGHFAMSPVPVFETVYYVTGTVRINIMCVHVLSHVQLSATPRTVARQAPLSMGLSWQECWSRLPFPSPGDLPDPGNEPRSLAPPALSGELYHCTIWEAHNIVYACVLSCFSRIPLFSTIWTVAHQAPLSTGFSKQEYWSELPYPSPGDLPNPGIKPTSLTSPALAGGFFTTSTTWEAQYSIYKHYFSAKLFESKLQTSHRFTSKTLNKYRPLTRGFSHTRTQSGLPAREICTGFRRGK